MTLDSIIERLEKAEGGDREIDIALGIMFPKPTWATDGSWFDKDDFTRYPAYTSSVDAAIALAAKALPSCNWSIDKRDEGDPEAWYTVSLGEILVDAKTPSIALCLAILKAKQMGVGE